MKSAKLLTLFGGMSIYGDRHSRHFTILFLYFFINVFSSIGQQSDAVTSPTKLSPSLLYGSDLKKNYHEQSCFVGQLCEYIIPVTDFGCRNEKIVISRVGENKLPRWLLFEEDVRKLTGIPFDGDDEILEILVVALTRSPNHAQFHVCGSSNVKINIWTLRYLPLFAGTTFQEIKSSRIINDENKNACGKDISIILASLQLSVEFSALNGEERRLLFTNLTSIYGIASENVFLLTKTTSKRNPFSGLLDSSYVISSGSIGKNNSSAIRSGIYLTWFVQCGMIEVNHAIFEDMRLQKHSRKWFMVNTFNITANRWFVVQGFQRRRAIRRRRNVAGGTTTAMHASTITSPDSVVTTRIRTKQTSPATDILSRTFSPPTTFPSFQSPSVSLSDHFTFSQSSLSSRLTQTGNSSASVWYTFHSSEITPSFTATTFRTSSPRMTNSGDTTRPTKTSAESNTTTGRLLSLSASSVKYKHSGTLDRSTLSPSQNTSEVHSTLSGVKSQHSKPSTRPPDSASYSVSAVTNSTHQSTYSLISSLPTSYSSDGPDITHSTSVLPSSPSLQYGNGSFTATRSLTLTPASTITQIQPDTPVTSESETKLTTDPYSSPLTLQTTLATWITETSYRLTRSLPSTRSRWLSDTDHSSSFPVSGSFSITSQFTSDGVHTTESMTTEESCGTSSKSISYSATQSTKSISLTSARSTTDLSISSSEFSKSPHDTLSNTVSFSTTQSTSIVSSRKSLPTNSYSGSPSSSEFSKSPHDTLSNTVSSSTTQSTSIVSSSKSLPTNSYSGSQSSSEFLKSPDATLSNTASQSTTQSTVTSTSNSLPTNSNSASLSSREFSPVDKSSTIGWYSTSNFSSGSPISTTIHSDTSSMESQDSSTTTQHHLSSTSWLTTLRCTTEFLSPISQTSSTSLVETPSTFTTTTYVSLNCSSLASNYIVSSLTNNGITTSLTPTTAVGDTSILTNTGSFSAATRASVASFSQNTITSSSIAHPTVPPNSPPKVYNGFDLLTITLGKMFRVQVPADTFYDREDGATRNLLLTCVTKDHKSLSSNSWLQFNSTSQVFYGIVLKSHSQREFITEFLLIATDSTGNQAYEAFVVRALEDNSIPAVEYKLRLLNTNLETFTEHLSSILLLATKIARFYTDEDTSLIKVESIEDGSVWFTWTNTTVRTCNLALIEELTSKITGADSEIQPAFQKWLLPEFNVENVYENKTGPCRPTTVQPVTERLSSTDDGLWLKLFIPGLIIALLVIVVAIVCFVFRRHAGVKMLKADERIFRRRKPVILDDEREMTGLSSKPAENADDSSIRRPVETLADDPVSENDDFSDRVSTPIHEKPPPMYEMARDDTWVKRTPPPPYKLPPSY